MARVWGRVGAVLGTAVLAGLLAALSASPARAAEPAEPVGLVVDGSLQRLSPPAFVRGGVAFAPADELVRALGGEARWDAGAGVLQGRVAGRSLAYRNGEDALRVAGARVSLPAAPEVVSGRLYVPVRPLVRALGLPVAWDGRLGAVVVGRGLDGRLPPARVAVNDRVFSQEVSPLVVDGDLLFPARPLLESLGYEVVWRQATGAVWFRRHGVRGSFRPGARVLVVDGRTVRLPAAPVLRDGRAYIPLSLLQAAGEQVAWHPAAWAVVARRAGYGPTASLTVASGPVQVLRRGAGTPEAGAPGTELRPGDRLLTGPGARAEVTLDDGSLLQVGAGSSLEVGTLAVHADASRHVSFRLLLGRVVARVLKLVLGNSRFEIETPSGVAGVRGTAFLVEVDPRGRSLVAVFSGAVQVSGTGRAGTEAVLVRPDEEARVEAEGAGPTAPAALRDVRVDGWLKGAVKKALVEEAADRLPPDEEAPAGGAGASAFEEGGPLPPPERLLEDIKAEMGDLRAALPQEESSGAPGGERRSERGAGEVAQPEPERKGGGEVRQEGGPQPGTGGQSRQEETPGEGGEPRQQAQQPAGGTPPAGAAAPPASPAPAQDEPRRDPVLDWAYPNGDKSDGGSPDGEGHDAEHQHKVEGTTAKGD